MTYLAVRPLSSVLRPLFFRINRAGTLLFIEGRLSSPLVVHTTGLAGSYRALLQLNSEPLQMTNSYLVKRISPLHASRATLHAIVLAG